MIDPDQSNVECSTSICPDEDNEATVDYLSSNCYVSAWKNRYLANFEKAKIKVPINRIEKLSYTDIENIVSAYKPTIGYLEYLWDYYCGRHDIFKLPYSHFVTKSLSRESKRIVYNYAQYVVDIITSFCVGIPIRFEGINRKIKKVFEINDSYLLNTEIVRNMGIFGVAYELITYEDDISIIPLDPRNIIPIYDVSIKENVIGFIYINKFKIWGTNRESISEYKLYTSENIHTYNTNNRSKSLVEHDLGLVPIIMYKNNMTETSDFYPVITQINEYNELMSQTVANQVNMTQSKVVLKTLSGDTNKKRIYEEATSPISKIRPDEDIEFKNRITQDSTLIFTANNLVDAIHKLTGIFNFSETGMSGNVSGSAVQGKLFTLEQKATMKSHYLQNGLRDRLGILYKIYGSENKAKEVDIIIIRNKPTDVMQNSQASSQLTGILSKKTLYETILANYVKDPTKEIEQLKQEMKEQEELKLEYERKRNEYSGRADESGNRTSETDGTRSNAE